MGVIKKKCLLIFLLILEGKIRVRNEVGVVGIRGVYFIVVFVRVVRERRSFGLSFFTRD